jgi:heat shock protein HslJ
MLHPSSIAQRVILFGTALCLAYAVTSCSSTNQTQSDVKVTKICSTAIDESRTGLQLANTWVLKGIGSSLALIRCIPGNLKEVTLEFKEDGRMDGTSTCNSLTCNYAGDGGMLQLTSIAVTEKLCQAEDIMQWEEDFLKGLQGTFGYTIQGNSLHLKTNNASDLFFILQGE